MPISSPAASLPWGPGDPQLPLQMLVEGTHSSPPSSKGPGKLPAASKDSTLRTGNRGALEESDPTGPRCLPLDTHLFCHQMSGVRFHLLGRGDVMGHLSQLRAPRGPSVMTTFGQGLRTVTKRWEVDLASQQGGSRHRGRSRLEEARWGKQHLSIS